MVIKMKNLMIGLYHFAKDCPNQKFLTTALYRVPRHEEHGEEKL
jgi:hypothetical protein